MVHRLEGEIFHPPQQGVLHPQSQCSPEHLSSESQVIGSKENNQLDSIDNEQAK